MPERTVVVRRLIAVSTVVGGEAVNAKMAQAVPVTGRVAGVVPVLRPGLMELMVVMVSQRLIVKTAEVKADTEAVAFLMGADLDPDPVPATM